MNLNLDLLKQHPAWNTVNEVCSVLAEKGHKAYLAGGCVRDGLLGRLPKDFDVATDAEPTEVESYFEKTIDIGKAFGVIIVHSGGQNIEVTTFRKDGDYTDGRHPDSVTLSSEVEDAKRRDFTVNGLFFDLQKETLIDHVKGVVDLQRRIIRAIGDPVERFKEDHLRPVRAIRFAAELDFEIDTKTWAALIAFRSHVAKVSKERISDEFRKLLLSKNPMKGFLLLKESQFLSVIWPNLSLLKSELYTRWLYKALHLMSGQKDLSLFLSGILLLEILFEMEHVGINYKVAMDKQLKTLAQFRFPREIIRSTNFCVKHFPDVQKLNTDSLILVGEPSGVQLLSLLSIYKQIKDEDQKPVERFRERYLSLSDQKGLLPEKLISGDDLEALGLPPGPLYADLIEACYRKQLEGDFKDKAAAQSWVKTYINRMT